MKNQLLFSAPRRRPALVRRVGHGLLCWCLFLGQQHQAASTSRADEPADSIERDYAAELPRIPPLEPDAALASFDVHEGFHLNQVAAEPLVSDPVAASFDADGRLYVCEMHGYSEQPDENLGIIRLLTDTDGDGRFDQSTAFAEGFSWPTAVICYDGGVFVGDAPDILFLKDTNGDGRADVREKVFTGFGKSNVQGLLNSFQWGLDHRIYGATSASGGQVRRADRPDDKPLSLNGRDFAFDPKTREISATTGGAQHGLTFDDWGVRYVCHNSDHAQQIICEDRYVARNPFLAAPSLRRSIAEDGPQAEVFRISPVEPWRIVRTRLRAKGIVPGVVEGGGRPAGYFTSATGITIYRGDAWPSEYRGQMFVGDVGSNVIHRKLVDREGIVYKARRADEGREFIASRDIWFRPVQFLNAPDGCLYVLDMYRETIEHPASIPPIIKQHVDLTSGRDRGRIYRITPDGFQQPPLPRLSQATTVELIETLASENGWRRDTAARLLHERGNVIGESAAKALHELYSAKAPLARLHALYLSDQMRGTATFASWQPLSDASPRVREHALRLAEKQIGSLDQLRLRELTKLLSDSDPRVRFQLALLLGELPEAERIAPLAQLALTSPDDEWLRLAALSSLSDGAADLLAAIADRQPAMKAWTDALQGQIAAAHREPEVRKALETIDELVQTDAALGRTMLVEFCQRLARTMPDWRERVAAIESGRLTRVLGETIRSALTTAGDDSQSIDGRVTATRSLVLADWTDARDVLARSLTQQTPQPLQTAALATLGQVSRPEAAAVILGAWPGFGPALRRDATELLMARPEWTSALLDAIAAGGLAATDLDPARRQQLLQHPNSGVRQQAEATLGGAKLARRQEVVDAYKPTLEMTGDPARGREHFRKKCAVCHKLEGFGHELGPNLASLQNRGAEAILLNVLDPNREVNPQYLNYVALTNDGRTLSGMISAETATSVTLLRAEGATDTVLRVDLEEMRSTGLSIMPEGMEKELDQTALADLIGYIMSVK